MRMTIVGTGSTGLHDNSHDAEVFHNCVLDQLTGSFRGIYGENGGFHSFNSTYYDY